MAAPLPAEELTLNLENVELKNLVTTVSEVTGKNFIVDPRVKGKVTVIASKPMDKAELYEVFLSILEVHGFATVPAGEVIKIVPDANAKQSNTPFATSEDPGGGDQVVTRILQVDNVAAAQLVPLLRPLIPQQGHLAAYAPTNVLIVSDRASNINRLVEIIQRIDQVSDSTIEVIPLKHASASEVVRILTALTKQPAAAGQAPASSNVIVADERTNSVLLGGDTGPRLRMRAIIAHLDTPLESTGNTQVIYLRYAKASELKDVLTNVSDSIKEDQGGAKAAAPAGAKGGVSIQADDATNALVITAPPDIMSSLESVIRKLDIRRAQVLVEAVIVEVSDTSTLDFGIQWSTRPTLNDRTNGFLGVGLPGSDALSGTVGGIGSGLPAGVTLGYLRYGDLRLLIRALEADTSSNLLSTPNLVTMDNEEAEITVGQNLPFVTGSYTNDGNNNTNPFQTIERQDVGISLKVTPQINEGDAVRLTIHQEVSDVDTTSNLGPTTNKRSINTTVLVDDGAVLVLGGLISDESDKGADKVPGFGDVPLLGRLFSSSGDTKRRRNLMVFLKPTILRDNLGNALVTGSKYNYLRSLQDALDEGGKRDQPLLPSLENFQNQPFESARQSDMAERAAASKREEAPRDPWTTW